ncbi:MAG: cob(I)yrinic acid a,c-diamide adenosyltransferase [Lachnospiraceae bacterium]|nr:cob(I)yrinic acid a,c-diamide adenosyltransferase [Lachnospiraceae bacterium]
MKIYTKNGDNGMSTLINHIMVSKSDGRFEALGTIDELNSHLGLVKCISLPEECEILIKIQKTLMILMSGIAEPANIKYMINESEVIMLEFQIDNLESKFPRIKEFVLPGGCEKSARIDVARTVARRAERRVIAIAKVYGIQKNTIQYLNRLSDYLYMLARYSDYQNEQNNSLPQMEEWKNVIETEIKRYLKNK